MCPGSQPSTPATPTTVKSNVSSTIRAKISKGSMGASPRSREELICGAALADRPGGTARSPRALSGRLGRADQRRADRLGHAVEAHDALAGARRREWFGNPAERRIEVVPVVGHPDISRRINVDVDLRLQTAADIAAGR